ncbi:MAG: cysteine desulfurase NifS [Candidatus Aminicenantes bacterium]|nr:MAG: cysteine desulfurase NifS [Candidatus Aminicenantes bacterium]
MKIKYYLDYNATTPTDPRVVEEMQSYFFETFHNPSSFYRKAGEARQAIENARERAAKLINAEPREIFFTSGGTESDNLAIQGTASKLKEKGNHIITSNIEHPAVLEACKFLEKKGYEVTYLPVDSKGFVNPDDLRSSIKDTTILVSIMHANNEIGTIQPLKELAAIAHEKGVYFHTDAVQSTGKIPVDVKELDVDMLSFSSHKIYGPKGMGVLYKKHKVKINPLILGGGHEKGLRSGTENVPGIVGLGKAAELALAEMANEEKRIRPIRDRLQKAIVEIIPESFVNGDTENKLYNTINVSIKYIEGESILAMLDGEGFALSSGSACSSKSLEPSHVLLALGLKHEDAHGSLRISLGKYNTEEDADRLLEVLPPIVERLRSISPFWNKK